MNAKQQRKNRLHLADMLENRITDKQFDMSEWTNHCGTVGCALGIAVLSGEFGYRWGVDDTDNGIAVRAGAEVEWLDVGSDLFGDNAMWEVFVDGQKRSRQQVAAELRAIK